MRSNAAIALLLASMASVPSAAEPGQDDSPFLLFRGLRPKTAKARAKASSAEPRTKATKATEHPYGTKRAKSKCVHPIPLDGSRAGNNGSEGSKSGKSGSSNVGTNGGEGDNAVKSGSSNMGSKSGGGEGTKAEKLGSRVESPGVGSKGSKLRRRLDKSGKSGSRDDGADRPDSSIECDEPDEPRPVLVARDDKFSAVSAAMGFLADVLENDSADPPGARLFVKNITKDPSAGTYSLAEDGQAVIYYPPFDPFVGQVEFEYKACSVKDGVELACDDATVAIAVGPPIISQDDQVSVLSTSNGTIIDVLENDSANPSGPQLIVKNITKGPSAGTCSLADDKQAVIYYPPADAPFDGQVEFDYVACSIKDELELACATATVTITVGPPIIAQDDQVFAFSTSNGTTIDVLQNDSTNPSGPHLIVKNITKGPSVGTCFLTDDGQAAIYYPPSDPLFVGKVEFEYEVCRVKDGAELMCDTATVTIIVGPPIIAQDDQVSVLSTSNGTTIDVLENDSTNPAGPLMIKNITKDTSVGTCALADNEQTVIYYPPTDPLFVGQFEFEYQVCGVKDGLELACDTATVTIAVGPATIAQDDEISVPSTWNGTIIDVLENDYANPSGPLMIKNITKDPSVGTCSLTGDAQAVIYYPPTDTLFVGQVEFEYKVCSVKDGVELTCDTAAVTVAVGPPIIALDDKASVLSTSNGTIIDVLENDSTNPSGLRPFVKNIAKEPFVGSCSLAENKLAVIYSPPSDPLFVGQVEFEYEACVDDRPELACDSATVIITVGPTIIAADDQVSVLSISNGSIVDVLQNDFANSSVSLQLIKNTITAQGSIVTQDDIASVMTDGIRIEVLQNDSTNPPDQQLIVKGITREPTSGSLALTKDKQAVIFSGPSGRPFIGEIEFEYEACTGDGSQTVCDRANVTLSFEPVGVEPTSSRPSTTKSPTTTFSASPSWQPTDLPSNSLRRSLRPTSGPSISKSPSLAPADSPSISTRPSLGPTSGPSIGKSPSLAPTDSPSISTRPSHGPTASPSISKSPSLAPTDSPSISTLPSIRPTSGPSISKSPSLAPTNLPSVSTKPSLHPTARPSISKSPSLAPTDSPSISTRPSHGPTASPSISRPPSLAPTGSPSISTRPSIRPTSGPSISKSPSLAPTDSPSISTRPSLRPTSGPSTSKIPSLAPTDLPSVSTKPSIRPTSGPSTSKSPSLAPTDSPSISTRPSHGPTASPSISHSPSLAPTDSPSISTRPSLRPTSRPSTSKSPSLAPTDLPSVSTKPSLRPTSRPSISKSPSLAPTYSPSISARPSLRPTASPSVSKSPSSAPTDSPSISTRPSLRPTAGPSISKYPSLAPTDSPSISTRPSIRPTSGPSISKSPSLAPTDLPSVSTKPSLYPTARPSISKSPSLAPTDSPSISTRPSHGPTASPSISKSPSLAPTGSPSISTRPSIRPTSGPSISKSPSLAPTDSPSISTRPSLGPTSGPSTSKTPSLAPTDLPSVSTKPSIRPTSGPSTSNGPSLAPTDSPSISTRPSHGPTASPSISNSPSLAPTDSPSISTRPSLRPTSRPSTSKSPSLAPTDLPSISTKPSLYPTSRPSISKSPSLAPTYSPSISARPSLGPTASPSVSKSPSSAPTDSPSISTRPSLRPTAGPSTSSSPSLAPTDSPSISTRPSIRPTSRPSISKSPSLAPTDLPSVSTKPSLRPTSRPSISTSPTTVPSDSPSISIRPSLEDSAVPSFDPTLKPTMPPVQMLVCISDRDFSDKNGRTCKYYRPPNVNQGCTGQDTTGWVNDEGGSPWEACCFCGGGTIGLPQAASNDDPLSLFLP